MRSFNDLRLLFEEKLRQEDFTGSPTLLYEPIDYTMRLGGKRIRPVMMMMSTDMFFGNVDLSIAPAIGVEMFHNFTLLHDDLMDKSPLRRGKETVYRRWGENAAILSGDVMFSLAYRYFMKTDLKYMRDVLNTFTDMTIEICEGQQLDMDFESIEDVSIDQYMEMIRLKTSVMLGASLKIGAMMADADKEDVERIYNFGVKLGLAFQLMDDYLDTFGDVASFGKNIGDDIATNKKTYLLVKALEKANGESMKLLQESLTKSCDDKFEVVKKLYITLGVDKDCKQEMERLYDESIMALNSIEVSEDRKSALRELAQRLLVRNR